MTKTVDLNELLGPAIESKVATEVEPLETRVARVRELMDGYLESARGDVRRQVLASLLAGIGQASPISAPPPDAALDLRQALEDLLSLLPSPVTPEQAPPKLEASSGPAPPPPTKLIPRDVTKGVYAVLQHIDKLKRSHTSMHSLRLGPLLQALIADIRILLRGVPEDHNLAERLQEAIRFLGQLKDSGATDQFIKGLAYADQFDTTTNWERLSDACWKKVDKFDRDAEEAPVSKRQPEPKVEEPKAEEPAKAEPESEPLPESKQAPPEWQALRAATGSILVIGNIKRANERQAQFKERYDLEPEWCLVDNDKANPRFVDSLKSRIASGNVAGVILLEGFLNHKVTDRIEDACYKAYIPYAFGGRGGTNEIRAAFDELNSRLACLGAFGAETIRVKVSR